MSLEAVKAQQGSKLNFLQISKMLPWVKKTHLVADYNPLTLASVITLFITARGKDYMDKMRKNQVKNHRDIKGHLYWQCCYCFFDN